ncbi:PLDc N-terminal domain-containing protein [Microbacterium sp. CIAB417]|uniref:PLDc N-terminal domain-containing protein n=1 Tax=Microbacterium sp. CIAB417 TaxID=2860287 RepID=UPI001FAE2716|nr:PLDc N-terminal domain-containing protein [Microbacterium sp. CIAB417]
MPFVFSLLVIALMIGALIDIITRDDSQVRHLPKLVWIIIVILLPLIGSVLWFALGREYSSDGVAMPRMPRRERAQRTPRAAAPTAPPARPVDTRTTEEQIADLDREIEEWRLRAEIEKRKQERGEA